MEYTVQNTTSGLLARFGARSRQKIGDDLWLRRFSGEVPLERRLGQDQRLSFDRQRAWRAESR